MCMHVYIHVHVQYIYMYVHVQYDNIIDIVMSNSTYILLTCDDSMYTFRAIVLERRTKD